MARFFCSVAAADRGEAVFGTASRVDRWLLVEAPGPWGPRSLPRPRGLADGDLLRLQRRAAAAGARTLLVRRPGRGEPADAVTGVRRVFAADSRPGRERLLTAVVADVALAELPLPFEPSAVDGEPTGASGIWEPVELFIGVCTHGRHDPCCAVWGRPVAAALARERPVETWEVSHMGGDRFAANVLVLPHGHYLGRVPPASAGEVVDAVLAGRRPAPYYRGRSCYPMPVQAAVELAAGRLAADTLDRLVPVHSRRVGERDWEVTLADAGGPGGEAGWRVVVRRDRGAPARLTCTAAHAEPAPDWRLLDLAPQPAA